MSIDPDTVHTGAVQGQRMSGPEHRPTPSQLRALRILTNDPATITPPGTPQPPKGIAYATAEWLVLHGYARPTHDPPPMGSVVITASGRKYARRELERPIPEVPVYLHARDGLTTERSRAIPGEPEVIDHDTLDGWWTEHALLLRAQALDRKTEARRLRDKIKKAA